MYQYTQFDKQFVQLRAQQFRDQLDRWQRGELTDEQLLPLRLQNGWYIQRYAPMARIAVPYGEISSTQLRMLARIARDYDRPDPELLAHAQQTQDELQASQPGLTLAYNATGKPEPVFTHEQSQGLGGGSMSDQQMREFASIVAEAVQSGAYEGTSGRLASGSRERARATLGI